MNTKLISIGQAAVMIGVAVSTLRRWEAEDHRRLKEAA